MTAEELRRQARHYRHLAYAISDPRAQAAALSLAAECDAQAQVLEAALIGTQLRPDASTTIPTRLQQVVAASGAAACAPSIPMPPLAWELPTQLEI